jgi:subtilase family serine protease
VAPDGLTPFDENDPNQVGWAVEISLDVQWAHAIAPDAAITLVLAKSNEDADILSATRYVVDHGLADVISQSFGEAEECMDPALLRAQHELFQRATAKRITLVASSGDDGAAQPSCDGTDLIKAASTPRFQRPLHLPSRGVPDVAYNGDVFGGVLVAFGVNIGPGTGPGSFFIVGGTSAGAPQWSALTALTDQVAHRLGHPQSRRPGPPAGLEGRLTDSPRPQLRPGADHTLAAGGEVVKEAAGAQWGGCLGYFSDPDGYLWKVASQS